MYSSHKISSTHSSRLTEEEGILRIRKKFERRRGFEPRTPSLQLGRSPLAVAARGAPGVIRTPNGGFGIRSPHHRQPGRLAPRLDSNQHCTAFKAVASGSWDYGRIVGSVGFEPTLDTV